MIEQTQDFSLEQEALCRRYCKQVKRYLVCPKSIKQPVLEQLQESLFLHLEANPTSTMTEIQASFGTPKQFAANVLEELDGEQLQKQLQRYRWRKIVAIAIIGLALAYTTFFCARLAIDRHFAEETIVIHPAVEFEGPIPTSNPID